MRNLLIVDDEANVLYSLEKGLSVPGVRVLTARTATQGIDLAEREDVDAIIVDVRLPDMSGLDALGRLRVAAPRAPVIVITAYASTDTAIEAMKRGALEYLLKPVDLGQLRRVVERALEIGRVAAPAEDRLPEAGAPKTFLVGNSPQMQAVYKAIGRVAPLDVPVLILGESGTGKELVARTIHQYSARAGGPFVAVNCAAIPETMLETEMFGHEKGAFTGADRRRPGRFEQADGGTILLDEIGDMASAAQAKVLRLLQDQRFERLGGGDVVRTDVRILAATNQDLDAAVAAGTFREDLLYRLKVVTIRLPPLRERLEDLPLLVQRILDGASAGLRRQVRGVSAEAMQRLQDHRWPGNVRELQGVMKHALMNAIGDSITVDCLPEDFTQTTARAPAAHPSSTDLETRIGALLAGRGPDLYERITEEVDKTVLSQALRLVGGNIAQAARLLGISRNTLKSKLRGSGISIEREVR